MPIQLTPITSPFGGLYATEDDLNDLRGIDNITSWSDLENTKVRNSDRIKRAFNKTDAEIEKLLKKRYTFPLSLTSDTDKAVLRYWSAVLTSYHLYTHRGQKDSAQLGPTMRGATVYDTEKKAVMDDIWAYRHGIRGFDFDSKATTPALVSRGRLRSRC